MEALANDLNTAEARAPIFELVRAANTAMDQGQLLAGDRDAILPVLADFDAVFDVIRDDDAELTRRALEWAEEAGRMGEVAAEVRETRGADATSRSRRWSPSARKPKSSAILRGPMQIRNELADKGVVIEDSKDGVRWKRK